MQCPRCGFENMPGMATCGRCRAVLVTATPIEVHPPRAGAGKRLRPLSYGLRRAWLRTPLLRPAVLAVRRSLASIAFGWLDVLAFLLSIVPGLGHVLTRRWARGGVLTLAWAASLAVGVYLLGMDVGRVLLGVAIALHAWLMIDAGKLRDVFGSALGRFALVAAMFVVLVLGPYGTIRERVERVWRGVYCAVDIPEAGILRNDFLAVRLDAYAAATPRHGDVVVVQKEQVQIGEHGREAGFIIHGGESVGEVLALPGDRVELKAGRATVTTPQGKVYKFRPPPPLDAADLTLTIPPEAYFVVVNWLRTGNYREYNLDEKVIRAVGLSVLANIHGRVIMVYNPPSHQHRLEGKDEG